LTARKSIDDFRLAMYVGGNDFILKPFDRTALLARIEHWMNRRAPAA
jgi:DNA-binding response OmpR family regulator